MELSHEFFCISPDCGVQEGGCSWKEVCPDAAKNSGVEVREIRLFLPGEVSEKEQQNDIPSSS